MPTNPKVSIIIPVFNGSNYLSEAIDSALAQSYDNIEVVVVNDGSNDGGATDAIAQKYRDSIRYFAKSNGGVATALNRAIDEMSGEYFSWLSHDDIYEPNKIAAQIDYLRSQEFPDDIVVYSDYSMLNENTGGVKRVYLQNCGAAGFRCRLLLNSDIHGCTLLIPRAAFDICGKFKPEAKATQDYEMWFRLGEHYRFHHIPQSLVIGRIHGEQLGVRIPWRVQENILLRSQWLSQINSDEVCDFLGESVQMSYAQIANSFAKKGFYRLALKAFLKALKSSSGKKSLNVPLIAIRLSISFVYGLTKKLYSLLKHRK